MNSEVFCEKLKNQFQQSFFVEKSIGDGSLREYIRFKSQNATYMLMVLHDEQDKKNLQNDQYGWILNQKLLESEKLNCPKIFEVFKEEGAILLEDLGEVDYCQLLKTDKKKAFELLDEVLNFLVAFYKIPKKDDFWMQTALDTKKLSSELHFFLHHMLEKELQIKLSELEKAAFLFEVENLCELISRSPMVFTHRDFHTKNIMVDHGKSYLIDFQDAKLGPLGYDLVSFCLDSYADFTLEERKQILDLGLTKLATYLPAIPALMLQRQLKALGSFAYISNLKGSKHLENTKAALEILDFFLPIHFKHEFYFLSVKIPEKIKSIIKHNPKYEKVT